MEVSLKIVFQDFASDSLKRFRSKPSLTRLRSGCGLNWPRQLWMEFQNPIRFILPSPRRIISEIIGLTSSPIRILKTTLCY